MRNLPENNLRVKEEVETENKAWPRVTRQGSLGGSQKWRESGRKGREEKGNEEGRDGEGEEGKRDPH